MHGKNKKDINLLDDESRSPLVRVHAPQDEVGIFRRGSKAGYKNWRSRSMSAWSVGSRASFKLEESFTFACKES
ncbi:hypothetical protein Phum_PHUM563030 [Pediculus humanus corporis]|uniref:Uncharacterized protein n=1 Tax=Pediculus humanus subsp. corporis TaxID=121224 RepID=E0W0T1_PEDHC|nr:uncharacterized protein Phum_PHUM563030 [Pediculus humanus corporis]EEB19237.1 hypothetical protein Phum_PHUM563030 [Pediculus humanus corporis]